MTTVANCSSNSGMVYGVNIQIWVICQRKQHDITYVHNYIEARANSSWRNIHMSLHRAQSHSQRSTVKSYSHHLDAVLTSKYGQIWKSQYRNLQNHQDLTRNQREQIAQHLAMPESTRSFQLARVQNPRRAELMAHKGYYHVGSQICICWRSTLYTPAPHANLPRHA